MNSPVRNVPRRERLQPELRNPTLTIVIPALNEEEAIGSTIQRCLAAREAIRSAAGLDRVDIVVVSDGSTDRTVEIAGSYAEVELVVFAVNQGYGAAIQAGWQRCPNDLLSFLDADGTCDPLYFGPMCETLIEGDYDIVLGCRMGSDSEMPRIRRLGNRIYALLLRFLSHREVQDTASGMRVVRRSALPHLMPLPDGLHFTPAMSARALIDDLRIAEVPMTYKERLGRSKLNVLKDGLRFLRVILETTLYVRPSRLSLPVIGLLMLASAVMIAYPTYIYVTQRHVEEWMIYRFLLSALMVTAAAMLLSATYVIEQAIAVSRGGFQRFFRDRSRWWTLVDERWILWGGIACAALGFSFAWPALASYATTREVTVHWSRIVAAMLCELLACQALITLFLNRIIRGVVRQQAAWLASLGSRTQP